MSILVFGRTGQVATELAAFDDVICLGRHDADLSDPKACADVVAKYRPKAVINAAAYTAVDQAEDEAELAQLVNAEAPAAIATACAGLGIPFVHISTDYVFDGTGDTPWMPDAVTAPQNVYGKSKRDGENAVRAAGGIFAILRTSWVVSAHGSNFVKTMLRLGADRDALSVVSDQIGGPTPARNIAAACYKMAHALIAAPTKTGTYHFSGAPDCSWADFARAIFAAARIECAVTDIATSDYPTPATRPANSRLECTSLLQTFDIARPDWRKGVLTILDDLERNS